MSSPSRRKFGLAVLSLVAALTLWPACRKPEPRRESAPTKITLAMDLWPGYYPIILAQERGLLKDKGVEVQVVFPQDTHGMLADFAGGKYDGICASIGDLILASRRNPGARFVLCTDESSGADQIIGAPTFKEPGKLKGARIGTTLGGFGELLVRRYVTSLGLSGQDVTIVNSDAADVPALLLAGKIDVGHTWEPYARRARDAGGVILYSSAETPGLVLDGLMVQERLITAQPEVLPKIIRAWFDMMEWWQANPKEAEDIIRRFLERNHIPFSSADLSGIKLCLREQNRRIFQPDARNGVQAAAVEYIEFFLSRGSLPSRVAPETIFDSRFVE